MERAREEEREGEREEGEREKGEGGWVINHAVLSGKGAAGGGWAIKCTP